MSSATLDSLTTLTTFGEMLRHLRRRARLTQREFGVAVGYSEAHVGRLESNERRPEVATVSTRFVEALDLEREPHLAARLIELAKVAHAAARSEVTTRPQLTNLPAPLTHFIGREREKAEVTKLILDRRLVTLTGAGGIGKTRLACEVGSALLANEEFPDGVWWVELVSVNDPESVPLTVAATLKLAASEGRSHLDALADHLSARHALLILDNCEHLIEACAALVESLLRRCPKLHVLASSRETLRVLGEAAYPVPSLTAPNHAHAHMTPERALDYEAVQLFVERVRAADLKFEFAAGNVEAIVRVCRGLDGIPLALELAAGLARAMTVGEIAAGLDEQRVLPAGGYRMADPRHQTMRRTLDWSYDLLSLPEQRLLARLTVFTGGWTAEAAAEVCGETGVEVLSLLDQLVHKSLVLTVQHDEVTRYRLLEPIRQYADEKLRNPSMGSGCEWEGMRDRHLAWFVTFAERAEIGFIGNEHGAWLKLLGDDYGNLLAALAWSRDHEEAGEAYMRMAVSLWRYWAHRREYREGAAWLEGALARISSASTSLRIKVLSGAIWLIAITGDLRRAAALAEENLQLSRESGDQFGVASTLAILAWWAKWQHDPEREIQLHEESVRAFRQTPDLWLAANEIRFMAVALLDRDLDRAVELIEEALNAWQKMGSTHGVCIALMNLGAVAMRRGEHERAYAFFEQSLPLTVETGYLELIADCLEGLGRADRHRSITLCEQRLAELRATGNVKEIAVTLHAMGQTTFDSGDYEHAGSIFEECLSLWRQLGGHSLKVPNIAWTLSELGHVARCQGKLHDAVARYGESLEAYQAASGPYGVAWVHSCLGYAFLDQGKVALAAEHFETSLKMSLEAFESDFLLPILMLAAMSAVARERGQTQRSAQLAGAAAVLLPDNVLARMRPIDRLDFGRVIAAARAQLHDPEFAAAWAEGAAMSLDQAVEYALSEVST